MRKLAQIFTSMVLLASVVGCGSDAAPAVAVPADSKLKPVHNGRLITIPEASAFVEIVNDLQKVTKPGARPDSALVAYFYKPDGSPFDPAPTDVMFTPEGGKSVSLSPAPAGDASRAGGFVSPVGAYGGAEAAGELTANLGGTATKVTLSGR